MFVVKGVDSLLMSPDLTPAVTHELVALGSVSSQNCCRLVMF